MTKEEIKSRILCWEWAKQNITVASALEKSGDRSRSFLDPGENETCVVYYDEFWYDFKQRVGGDVISLVMLAQGTDFLTAFTELGGDYIDGADILKARQTLADKYRKAKNNLSAAAQNYLEKRGLTRDYINKRGLGQTPDLRISIPYFENSDIVYGITRKFQDTGATPKYKMESLRKGKITRPLWGIDTISSAKTTVWLTEGAFDAMTLDQSGESVLAYMGGNPSVSMEKSLRGLVRGKETVVLGFDSDEAGKQFTCSALKLLHGIVDDVRVVVFPAGCKDINEYYLEYHRIPRGEELVPAVEWMRQYLLTDDGRVSEKHYSMACSLMGEDHPFLLKAKKQIGAPFPAFGALGTGGIESMFGDFIAKAKKDTKAMFVVTLARELISAFRMEKDKSGVLWRWKEDIHSGVWERVTSLDGEIINKIEEVGGVYTARLVNEISKYIMARVPLSPDRSRYFSVLNGTWIFMDNGLGGEFKRTSPEISSRYRASFELTEEARMKTPVLWTKFLNDVTQCKDGEERQANKLRLLQQAAGYCLYQDNSLDRAFFLYGSGANGKSVFLETLEKILPTGSVEHIPLYGLSDHFQIVALDGAMLNISSEGAQTKDLKGEIIKQMISGEPVSACRKYQDFFTFTPRCKFFFAGNDLPQWRDMSQGIRRRIRLISFDKTFDFDTMDPDLSRKLEAELPQIFYWMLVGYQDLRASGEFVPVQSLPASDIDLEDRFQEMLNPIVEFYNEMAGRGEFLNAEYTSAVLYGRYKQWAIDSNRVPIMSRNRFTNGIISEMQRRGVGEKIKRGGQIILSFK